MARPRNPDPLDDTYEVLGEAERNLAATKDWAKENAKSLKDALARAMALGKPLVTANQVVQVTVAGRRHFPRLLGNAFTLLFEGKVTMRFRRKTQ